MITLVAHVHSGELYAARHEDGKLYHHSIFRGDDTPRLIENEESFLFGAAKHDWDMRPIEFATWEDLHAFRLQQAAEVLQRFGDRYEDLPDD